MLTSDPPAAALPADLQRAVARHAPSSLAALAARSDAEGVWEWLRTAGTVGELGGGVWEVVDALVSGPWGRGRANAAALLDLVRPLVESAPTAPLARLAERALSDGAVDPVAELVRTRRQKQPDDVGLVRLAIELAMLRGDRADAHALLTHLATVEPHAATVQAVLRRRAAVGELRAPDVRIALLSTFTVDSLVGWVDLEARRIGLVPTTYVAPFNTIPLEVLDPQSGLHAFGAELVIFAAALDDLAPELAGPTDAAALEAIATRVLAEVATHVRTLHERTGATIVVHDFSSAFIGTSPLEWRAGGRGPWLRALNLRLAEALAPLSRVQLLDLAQLAATRTDGPHESAKMRYMAGMRIGDGLAASLGRAYARYLVPLKGLTRKCLVLDLDNTMWGGIVGEDGPDGIRLGNTAPGVEYHDFQLAISALAKRGILLALNSKNNPDDALAVIRSHPWMVLREADFSAVRINWESKVENLRAIAKELNIGIDSLVFMDDNPVECEQVRQLLPEVVVVQMPRDPSRYRATLESLPWFDAFTVTAEDLQRVGQYRANRERDVLRESTGTVADYLRSLGVTVTIAPVVPATAPRVVQLLARTNQFNLTTRRHASADIDAMLGDGRWRHYTVTAEDRFGQHGLVALALVERTEAAWRIDTLLMSCRVIGQGIEQALLAEVHAAAVADGARQLIGEYRPSAKNAQVRDFYERQGFTVAATQDDGSKTLTLALPASLSFPDWIERRMP